MLEFILNELNTLDPTWVVLFVFGVAFIENIFPPSPSDIAVVAAASTVGLGRVGFGEVLFAASFGATLGFVAMYKVGQWFGVRILEAGKISFIPRSGVETVEGWFRRYGYWIIVANRFLAGTRAVVSFFAGMSDLRLPTTIALSFVSSLAWNSILVAAGYALGRNWERLSFYLNAYGQVATAIVLVVALLLIARYFYRKGNGTPST